MAMAVGGASRPNSDINITPLVDVVLVLLIIFMVMTPILQKGFDMSVPQKAPPTENPSSARSIVLLVEPGGRMSVNRKPATMSDLGDTLSAIYSTRSDKILFIDADDRVNYQELVEILDICKAQGKVETIGFVLN